VAEETTKSGMNLKPLILIASIVTVLLLGTVGVGFWFIYSSINQETSHPKEEVKAKSAEFGVIVEVGEIKANVGADGFVVTNVNLQVGNEDVKKELDEKLPAVRDYIIKIFRGQLRADLDKPDAQDKLAKQIKGVLNEKLAATGQVENVYFSDFLVQ
jgi:flagellar basal body-associated protein FliL